MIMDLKEFLKHIKIKDKKTDEEKLLELKDYQYSFLYWLKEMEDKGIKYSYFL